MSKRTTSDGGLPFKKTKKSAAHKHKRPWNISDRKFNGPGNDVHEADVPVDEVDAAAKTHDQQYAELKQPYSSWSDADDEYLRTLYSLAADGRLGLDWSRYMEGFAGLTFFQAKKILYKLGVINKTAREKKTEKGGKTKHSVNVSKRDTSAGMFTKGSRKRNRTKRNNGRRKRVRRVLKSNKTRSLSKAPRRGARKGRKSVSANVVNQIARYLTPPVKVTHLQLMTWKAGATDANVNRARFVYLMENRRQETISTWSYFAPMTMCNSHGRQLFIALNYPGTAPIKGSAPATGEVYKFTDIHETYKIKLDNTLDEYLEIIELECIQDTPYAPFNHFGTDSFFENTGESGTSLLEHTPYNTDITPSYCVADINYSPFMGLHYREHFRIKNRKRIKVKATESKEYIHTITKKYAVYKTDSHTLYEKGDSALLARQVSTLAFVDGASTGGRLFSPIICEKKITFNYILPTSKKENKYRFSDNSYNGPAASLAANMEDIVEEKMNLS